MRNTKWSLDWSIVERLGLRQANGKLLSNGTNAEFDCPRCHRKKKFHICIARDHKRFGYYQCLSAACDNRGRFRKKKSTELDLSYLRNARKAQLADEALADEIAAQDVTGSIRLPRDFAHVLEGSHAWRYLIKRGITPSDIRYYDLGIAEGRIFFPDYDEDEKLVYWVSREYDGFSNPKYLNVAIDDGGATREKHIHNLGRFLRAGYEEADIVEGPITGIVAGRSHLALLGKPSRPQVDALRELGKTGVIKRVYLALDPDARAVCMQLAHDLWGAFKEIWIVPIPIDEDVATIGRKRYRELKRTEAFRYDVTLHTPLMVKFVLDGPMARPRRPITPRRDRYALERVRRVLS